VSVSILLLPESCLTCTVARRFVHAVIPKITSRSLLTLRVAGIFSGVANAMRQYMEARSEEVIVCEKDGTLRAN
jgi:hypothetical protein